MNKKQIFATLATSTLILSTGAVGYADENTPVDPTVPTTEIVETTEPVAPVEIPTEPTQPVETPTDLPSPTETGESENPAPPVDTTTPTEPISDTSEETSTSTEVSSTDSNAEKPTEPVTSEEPKTDTTQPVETPKTAEQANQEGKSQEGTTSTVTGQVVQTVTPEAPIQTSSGVSIVSTQNGQVVLHDGSTVAPEAIGAVTNGDKTITVTKADGTKVTLPHTGEAESALGFLGLLLSTSTAFIWKKRRQA